MTLYETRVWRLTALRYALPATLQVLAVEGVVFPVLDGATRPGKFDAATAQHFVLAGLCPILGVVELLRALGQLQGDVWRAPLPAGMLATGVIFVFHAQHEMHAPTALLTVQHRILGASLAVGAMTKTVAELPHRVGGRFAVAWLVPLFLAGVELLLYTEGSG